MSPTNDLDAPEHPPAPAPFGVQVILAFLALDGLERAAELGHWLWVTRGAAHPPAAYAVNLPVFGLWAVVDALLVLLLVLRTRAGRWFGVVIFALHAGYLTHVLSGVHPELWIYLGTLGRVRVAATGLIDVAAACYLLGRGPEAHLIAR